MRRWISQDHDIGTAYSVRNANLRGARFVNMDLRNADFGGSDLTGAWFDSCVLRGANFESSIGTAITIMHSDITGVRWPDRWREDAPSVFANLRFESNGGRMFS